MDFRKLRYFSAVARAGSFVAASRELNVSQPALGMRVKDLETDLGVCLFERTPRGVVATAAGIELLQHCDEIFDRVAAARDAMAAHKSSPVRQFTLGMTPTPGKALLPDLLALSGPGTRLTLTIREGLSVELVEHTTARRVDMAFCYDPPELAELTAVPLYQEDLYLVGPPAIMAEIGDMIAFSDIAALPLVLDSVFQITRQLIERKAQELDVSLDVRLEIEPINLKRDVLIANGLCTIVPYGLFINELDTGLLSCARIRTPALARTLCLIARSDFAKADFDYMQSVLRPIVAGKIAANRLAWRAL